MKECGSRGLYTLHTLQDLTEYMRGAIASEKTEVSGLELFG